jgi:N-acetylmuramoyl-L-alanine amidase
MGIQRLAAIALFFVAVAPTAPSEPNPKMVDHANDVELLARVVWHEARGEPRRAKVLVAQTVLERVRDPRWPDTVAEVITQGSQYSNFDINHRPSPWAPGWRECVEAAREAIRLLQPRAANHFHAVTVMPHWHDPKKVIARAGGHIFLRL